MVGLGVLGEGMMGMVRWMWGMMGRVCSEVLGDVGVVDHNHWNQVNEVGVLEFDVHLECIFGAINLEQSH